MQTIPGRFDGRTAIVTGGVSGIGRACVDRLVAEGASVVVLDRDQRAGERLVAEAEEQGRPVRFVQVDLLDEEGATATAAGLASELGAVHVLINCAGIVHIDGKQDSYFVEGGLAGWDSLVGVNLKAMGFLVHALLPALTAGKASIINVSSEAAFKARPNKWIYDMTKAGVLSITRSMAAALADRGIRVNAVAPGGTVTEMHTNDADDPEARRVEMESMKTRSLLGRFARPEEIAAPILFLASDDASMITATTLRADGGTQALS